MHFRPFLPDDEQRLKSFQCARKSDPAHQRLVTRMFRNDLVETLSDPSRDLHAFVAVDDSGALAGIIALEAVDPPDWTVVAIGTSIDHKRSGVASALIRFGVACPPARDARAVIFEVHDENRAMRRLMRNVFGANGQPDPGSIDHEFYALKPAAIIADLDAAMVRARIVGGRGGLEDDDLRLGLGLKPPL